MPFWVQCTVNGCSKCCRFEADLMPEIIAGYKCVMKAVADKVRGQFRSGIRNQCGHVVPFWAQCKVKNK